MDRPPCWPEGRTCPNTCADQLYQRIIHNLTPLHGPWAGWRMAGRVLVSPDGDRISPERLRGILWAENLRRRRHKSRKAGQQEEGRTIPMDPRTVWKAGSRKPAG